MPDLRPLEIKVPHALSTDAARACVERVLPAIAEGSIQSVEAASATMDPLKFVVTEPIDGVIRVRADEITASFEAPMWVPSQRAQFEVDLTGGLTGGVAAASAPRTGSIK